MNIVISHTSAIEFWQAYDSKYMSALRPCAITRPFFKPGSDLEIRTLSLDCTKPLHVLVSDKSGRRNSQQYCCHTCSSSLPRGSLFEYVPGVYICSPELCFIQMASVLPFVKLVELGIELCGTYRPVCSSDISMTTRRIPLTSRRKLIRFIERASTMRGATTALKALKWVNEGSASPMETFLWMRLCLSPHLGGRGFPRALFNHPIELTVKQQAIIGKATLRCDLFFPQKQVGVEYESAEFHSNSQSMANDSVRRGVLESAGIHVVTVTNQEFFTYDKFEGVVKQIAFYLGKRLVSPTEKQLQQRKVLRNTLLNPGLMHY